jgi:hypothetical protein
MQTTAIEINPKVLVACRGWFKLPADNARMQVVLADAEQEIADPKWWGSVDALQVDLYDHDAAAPVLDSAGLLCGLPPAADRRRLHDRQPVRPLIELHPQRRAHGGGIWRRGDVAFQVHPRGQHRRAGAEARLRAPSAVSGRPGPTHHRPAVGPAGRAVGAGAQAAGAMRRARRPAARTPHVGPIDWRSLVEWLRAGWRDRGRRGTAHHRALFPGRKRPASAGAAGQRLDAPRGRWPRARHRGADAMAGRARRHRLPAHRPAEGGRGQDRRRHECRPMPSATRCCRCR